MSGIAGTEINAVAKRPSIQRLSIKTPHILMSIKATLRVPPLSAMGHLQTFPTGQPMSAIPLEADVGEPASHVG
jgi:hypothetical protein